MVEFGQKLRNYLGHSREGYELTVMDVADFYKLFKASGLSFEAWVKSVREDRHPEPEKEFTIDLCSFVVYADSREEARGKAIKLLESGEERAIIDQVIEAPPARTRQGKDSKHVALSKPCKCGCVSATITYCKDTTVVATLICDNCGEDLR